MTRIGLPSANHSSFDSFARSTLVLTEEARQPVKLGRAWPSRFLSALSAYLALVIVATWSIPIAFRPPELLPSLITAKPYVLRNEKFLYSDSNPQIILIGSSLVLKPSFDCDKAFEGLSVPVEQIEARRFKQNYTKSEHLRRLLQSQLANSLQLVNLGVPVCMLGDYYLTLQKLLDFGKRPQLIILALAPREFLDNGYPDPHQTASYQLISACSPVRKWQRHPLAALDYIEHFSVPGALVDSLSDAVKGQAFSYRYAIQLAWDQPFYWMVDQYRRGLVAAAPQPIATSASSKKTATQKYIDLDAYRWCYHSPDMDHFGRQISYLEKFVSVASGRNISVVLVDMPITTENQALLDPGVLSMYKKVLHAVANKYNVMLVDACKISGCKAEDFVDSVHLNVSGGHKCFDCIAKSMGANSVLKEKLCAVQSTDEL